MRSTAFLGASLLVVLATACGDDGGSNNGSCGDGHVTGSEQCDDGNTANGDGCSASCQTETGGGVCGDSTVDVNKGEQCDDGNTANGDGCSATCQNEQTSMCGNGQLNGAEACDDGDTMSGDGCSATCTVESGYMCTGTPSVCTMNPTATGTCAMPIVVALTGTTTLAGSTTGNTMATGVTDQVGDGPCDQYSAEGATGNDQIVSFTTPDTRDVTITLTPGAGFDPLLRLTTTACMLSTELPDSSGDGDGCSDAGLDDEAEVLTYVALPAGTYYLVVDGFDNTEAGTWTVMISAKTSTCGNGKLEMGEACDDGDTMGADGCSAQCTVETGYTCRNVNGPMMPTECRTITCGNGWVQGNEACDDNNTMTGDGCDAACAVETGFVCNSAEPSFCAAPGCGNGVYESATEECDDHNLVAGDRCSATCTLESDVTEVEPNDTAAQAQVLTAGSHIIRGSLLADDNDLYTFTLTAPSNIEIETYDVINGVADYTGVGSLTQTDCYMNDTIVAIYNSTGDPTDDGTSAIIGDDEDGDISCTYIGPNDSADNFVEMGADPNQGKNLPAGTYTIRVVDFMGTAQSRYLLDLKITPVSTTPVAPAVGDLAINEILASDSTINDSNCDGSTTSTSDEFVELVNVSNKTLDLTGVTIWDNAVLQFTFAAQASGSLTLAPGKAVVVWAGGAPACPGVTNFFVKGGTNSLSLNDDGDTVQIKSADATPVVLASQAYGTGVAGSATLGVSWNRSPDVTGTTVALHTMVTGAVGNSSAGKKVDGSAF